MSNVVTCPKCRRKLKLTARSVGNKVRCAGCGTMFQAPSAVDADPDDLEIPTAPVCASSPRQDFPDDEAFQVRRPRRNDEDKKHIPWAMRPPTRNVGWLVALSAAGVPALVRIAAVVFISLSSDALPPQKPLNPVERRADPLVAAPFPGPQEQPDIAKDDNVVAQEMEKKEPPAPKIAADPSGCWLLSHGRGALRSFALSQDERSLLLLSGNGTFSEWDVAALQAHKTG